MESNLKSYLAFLRTRHAVWLYKDELGGEWISDGNPKDKGRARIPLPDGFIKILTGMDMGCDDAPVVVDYGYVHYKSTR